MSGKFEVWFARVTDIVGVADDLQQEGFWVSLKKEGEMLTMKVWRPSATEKASVDILREFFGAKWRH
jgi:hypothetical protein